MAQKPTHTTDETGRIALNLPSGVSQTWSTRDINRLSDDEIEIAYIDREDLRTIAEQQLVALGSWWDTLEPPGTQPPWLVRVQRLAKRMQPWAYGPDSSAHSIKAVHKPTNVIIGFALWQAPGHTGQFPTSYPLIPGVKFPSTFAPGFSRDTRDIGIALGWDVKEGWSEKEIDEMWGAIDRAVWREKFIAYDLNRLRIMGERPHWYLAPLYVAKDWQGKGVSSKLLQWGHERAMEQRRLAEAGVLEAQFKKTCCYLETAPAARAVYLHAGYKEVDDKVMVWEP